MAGTVVTTEQVHTTVKKITFDWLSSALGAADATTTLAYDGLLERVVFIPDSGGTQPTNLYDVVLNDPNGIDVLNGQGANLSNVAASVVLASSGLMAVAGEKLTLGVTNAGDSKGGMVIVYLR